VIDALGYVGTVGTNSRFKHRSAASRTRTVRVCVVTGHVHSPCAASPASGHCLLRFTRVEGVTWSWTS
jgi:hypothetical protein